MIKDRIIISIFGPAGSGKSALAKKLVEQFGERLACRIPADYYLRSSSASDLQEFLSKPFKYDWELIKKVVSSPIGSDHETPDFDFLKFIRLDRAGGKRFTIKRYIILDPMLPYPDSDYIILLQADEKLRLKRIKERDLAQRTASARAWPKMELTARELTGIKADLVLNGELPAKTNTEIIIDFLEKNDRVG